MSGYEERFEQLREIIAEVLEIETDELTDTGDFAGEYDADSLRAIEIVARIDKSFKVEIPQDELPELLNLKLTYDALARHAGWQN